MIKEGILTHDCGSIEVYQNNNDDLSVVNSARVSFAKRHDEIDVEKDPRLINYLRTHNHFTPFTHARFTFTGISMFEPWKASPEALMGCVFKAENGVQKVRHSMWGWKKLMEEGAIAPWFYSYINEQLAEHMPHSWEEIKPESTLGSNAIELVKPEDETDPDFIDMTLIIDMPFYIARQWFKHQVGFSRNEVSRRYVSDTPTVFLPDTLRAAPTDGAKQGSSDVPMDNHDHHRATMHVHQQSSLFNYEWLVNSGCCPEQARGELQMSTMTQFFETGSLSAYNRLLKQRLDSHAQLEIRKYAEAIKEIIQ